MLNFRRAVSSVTCTMYDDNVLTVQPIVRCMCTAALLRVLSVCLNLCTSKSTLISF